MKVAIVILHYADQKLTENCLASVAKLKTKGFDLKTIVVDNNPDKKLRELKTKHPAVEWLATKENLGFTGGNNLGLKKALEDGADWAMLLNNDTIVDKDLVSRLIKTGVEDNNLGVIGPKIYFAPGFEYHAERYKPGQRGKVFWYAGGLIDWDNVLASHRGVDEVDTGQYDRLEETDYVSGCCLLARRRVFEKVGLLDDKYFLYLEDADFCQRAKKAGFKVVYQPKAKLWHANAGSSQVGGNLHDYFFTRNRMLFGWHHASWRAKFALTRESARLMVTGRPWQKKGIQDFYTQKWRKGSWHE